MDFIHVRNLEKFHPGYKDRKLIWAKIFFSMVQGDPDCEMITNEIDWSRLIKFIILELQARKPIPLDYDYLFKKGIDNKQRKIELTLQCLHAFVAIVTNPLQSCDVEKSRVYKEEEIKKSRVDKESFAAFEEAARNNWNSLCDSFPSLPKIKEITVTRRKHLKERFEKESFRDFQKILDAIKLQPFLIHGNPDSQKHSEWKISFDWLIANDTNYVKVLEMKYSKPLSKLDIMRAQQKKLQEDNANATPIRV